LHCIYNFKHSIMENHEKEFTPEESLQLISQIIAKTRRNIKISSFYFILWGWITVFSSLTCFFLIKYMVSTHQCRYINIGAWMAWIVPAFIGLIISVGHAKKMDRSVKVKSQIGSIIKVLWYSNAVVITIGCFISYKLNFYPAPLVLIIIGLSTFMTGYIIKFKPIIYGGTIFWLAGILSVFIQSDYQLLLTAVSIVAGYLVPGYMLKYSKD
jgi:hypothetical protein